MISPLIMDAASWFGVCVCDRCMEEHRENWDLMSAAGSVAAIDDPVLISSGEAWSTCRC